MASRWPISLATKGTSCPESRRPAFRTAGSQPVIAASLAEDRQGLSAASGPSRNRNQSVVRGQSVRSDHTEGERI